MEFRRSSLPQFLLGRSRWCRGGGGGGSGSGCGGRDGREEGQARKEQAEEAAAEAERCSINLVAIVGLGCGGAVTGGWSTGGHVASVDDAIKYTHLSLSLLSAPRRSFLLLLLPLS